MKKYLLPLLATLLATPALGGEKLLNVEELRTPGGIKVLAVKDGGSPLVTVEVAFMGGAAFDRKPGTAGLLSILLNESVCDGQGGTLSTEELTTRLQRVGAAFGGEVGQLSLSATLTTLTDNPENLEEALRLFGLGLSCPAFAEGDVARMKRSVSSKIMQENLRPTTAMSKLIREAILGNQPLANWANGTLESLNSITVADLQAHHSRVFTRQNMVVSVVGDMPEGFLNLLDKTFGLLPEGMERLSLQVAKPPATGGHKHIHQPGAQTIVRIVQRGPGEKHPDYPAWRVLNHVLGGASLGGARITTEVREKRGLSYGAGSFVYALPSFSAIIAYADSRNETALQARDITIAEFQKIRHGITREEFTSAREALINGAAMAFSTNERILGYLTSKQVWNESPADADHQLAALRALSLEEVNRVAEKWFVPESLVVLTIGNPAEVASQSPSH